MQFRFNFVANSAVSRIKYDFFDDLLSINPVQANKHAL